MKSPNLKGSIQITQTNLFLTLRVFQFNYVTEHDVLIFGETYQNTWWWPIEGVGSCREMAVSGMLLCWHRGEYMNLSVSQVLKHKKCFKISELDNVVDPCSKEGRFERATTG